LHNEHILAAYVLLDLHEGFAIGERFDRGFALFDVYRIANLLAQRLIDVPLKIFTMRKS